MLMAEMTIRLVTDPATGKKDILVDLSSDADSLPHEHEQLHRRLVEQLVEGGLVKASEVGQVIVQREEEAGTAAAPSQQQSEQQRQSRAEGN
jgi:hypothetical protein